MKRPPTQCLLLLALLTLTLPAGITSLVHADDLVRVSRDVPGESKPIIIDADEITTWAEGPLRVLLFKGQVLLQHGVLRARFREGVLLVDTQRYQVTHVWDVTVYGEGDAVVQNNTDVKTSLATFLDLHTRGELKFNAHKSKVKQQARPEDPLYRRALAQQAAARPVTILPTSSPPPGGVTPAGQPNPVKPVSYTPPGPPAPAPPMVPVQDSSPSTTPVIPAPVPQPPPPAPTPGAAAPPAPAPPSGLAMPAPPLPPLPGSPGTAAPGPRPQGLLAGPLGGGPPGGPAPVRQYSIIPRTPAGFQSQVQTLTSGERVVIVTGGFVLNVRGVDDKGQPADMLDIEADRLVLWTRGDPQQLFNNLRTIQGTQTNHELEFYLSGHVAIRSRSGKEDRTLRAEEVYYDVSRNVAVAIKGDLEYHQPGIPDPIHLRAEELDQLSLSQFRASQGHFFSSRLPSDPGLTVVFTNATLEEKRVPKRSLFGRQVINRQTGQPETVAESLVHADNVLLKVEQVPLLWFPYVQGDARDPLGPIQAINLGYNRIFGAEVGLGVNVYNLLGIDPIPGTRWRADVNYLSKRGPVLSSNYDFAGKDLFGIPNIYNGTIKLAGMHDTGEDILGGGRGIGDNHPDWRGRATPRLNVQELPLGFSAQAQISALSDRNYLEQYYQREFDEEANQETFLYVKQQQDNWAWTALVEPRIRNWVTETQWLPRLDGYLLGQSFFDLLTYNVHGSAGYALFRPAPPSQVPPPNTPFSVTDQQSIDTARLDLMQELSLPFYLGPVKVVPYGLLDLAWYSQDLEGDSRGRLYGGGGVRASMPLSCLFPDVHSLLWNLNGINHKIMLSGNYYLARSSDPYSLFPQLDRLNDDATDQSQRDIRPNQPFVNPNRLKGQLLSYSPLFDPQVYAIRRLVDNRVDTLDTIDVLQLDLRQRWQTKRGYPGQEHIIDWMTLDLSASIFPQSGRSSTWPYQTYQLLPPGQQPPPPAPLPNAQRDNFDEPFAFLEYNWLWNIGDRTALASTGWVDPIDNGPRVFTFGTYLNRPDRTNIYLGYRQIDPLHSKAVVASLSYVFSPKYAMTASSVYDFGTAQAVSNSLIFTRMGSDLQVSIGFTYNTLQNNFGFTFEVIPNLIPANRHTTGLGTSPGALGMLGR